MQFNTYHTSELLRQAKAVTGVKNEGYLLHLLADGEMTDHLQRPRNKRIIYALLNLVVQKRIVGGKRGHLRGPVGLGFIHVTGVKPKLCSR